MLQNIDRPPKSSLYTEIIYQKSGNIKFQCSAREIFLLDVPHENCNGTEKELGAKSAQMFYYECKGHFTLHRKTNIS